MVDRGGEVRFGGARGGDEVIMVGKGVVGRDIVSCKGIEAGARLMMLLNRRV